MNMEKQAKKLMKGAKSNWNKAKRTYVCRSVKDLIKAYRACTTKSEERALVKKEAAHIRDLFREGDRHFRRQNIAKLLFFHMNGYPTDFGITECIKLCASNKFPDKRVAYLGMMVLVDETEQVLMLMTNSLQQDLNSHDSQIIALALTVLGDIASAEMVRELMPDIEKHLRSPNPYIRKKAALAAVRAVRKLSADETVNILHSVPDLFESIASAVHVSGSALVVALCRQSASNAEELQVSIVPSILNILQEHASTRSSQKRSDIYGGTRDIGNPFVQAKLISTLRILLETVSVNEAVMPRISEVLGQLLTKHDTSRIANCAILYECVRVATLLGKNDTLLMQSVQTLGKFLTHKEATVRYIALQQLTNVVDMEGPDVVNRIDDFKKKLLMGLHEADPTIRRQAVELVYRITDASNVVEMVKELLKYLEKSKDREDIRNGCEKIFVLADQFGTSEEWKIETFVRALSLGDFALPEELMISFVGMVSSKKEVQPQAVSLLFREVLHQPRGSEQEASTYEVISEGGKAEEQSSENTARVRKHRSESIASYLLGEHGEVTSEVGIGTADVLRAFQRLLKKSAEREEEWMKADSDEMNIENKALGEIVLSGLAKFASRIISGTQRQAQSATTVGVSSLEQELGLLGPSSEGPLMITAGPDSTTVSGSGLADELLGLDGAKSQTSQPPDVMSRALTLVEPGALVPFEENAEDMHVFDNATRFRQILSIAAQSEDVEWQQRACEYLSLLEEDMRPALGATLAPLPPMSFNGMKDRLHQIQSKRAVKSSLSGGTGLLVDLLGDEPEPSRGEYGHLEQVDRINVASSSISDDPFSLIDGDSVLAIEAAPPAHSSSLQKVMSIEGAQPTALTPSQNSTLPDSTKPPVATISQAENMFADLLDDARQAPKLSQETTGPHAPTESVEAVPEEQASAHLSSLEPSLPEHNEKASSVADPDCSVSVLQTADLDVSASFYLHKEDPSHCRAEVTMTNTSVDEISQCLLQVAVPKYMTLEMQPASAAEMASKESITQTLKAVNSMYGSRPLQLRYRLEYRLGRNEELVRQEGIVRDLDGL